jgi:diacylglycerol kinase
MSEWVPLIITLTVVILLGLVATAVLNYIDKIRGEG